MISSKAFENLFKHLSTLPWKNEIGINEIFNIAVKNFETISAGHTKHHNMLRLIGQSGSGKTTQLLPSATAFCEQKSISPIVFAVRNFASLYPNFENLAKETDKGEIRELTNGFALRCLTISLALAIEQGYDIVLEVTLLSKEYEEFLMSLSNKNKYKFLFLCVATSKETSDRFILMRMLGKTAEGGRKVSCGSSDFFFEALGHSLRFYAQNFEFRIIIWNAFDPLPVFDGSVKNCLSSFFAEREKKLKHLSNPEVLLSAKIEYLKDMG